MSAPSENFTVFQRFTLVSGSLRIERNSNGPTLPVSASGPDFPFMASIFPNSRNIFSFDAGRPFVRFVPSAFLTSDWVSSDLVPTKSEIAVLEAKRDAQPGDILQTREFRDKDATITTADVLFGSCTYPTGLGASTASDCSGPITVPNALSPGTYYVGAIADALGQLQSLVQRMVIPEATSVPPAPAVRTPETV